MSLYWSHLIPRNEHRVKLKIICKPLHVENVVYEALTNSESKEAQLEELLEDEEVPEFGETLEAMFPNNDVDASHFTSQSIGLGTYFIYEED